MSDSQSFPFESKTHPRLWDGAHSKQERYSQLDVAAVVEYARPLGPQKPPESTRAPWGPSLSPLSRTRAPRGPQPLSLSTVRAPPGAAATVLLPFVSPAAKETI